MLRFVKQRIKKFKHIKKLQKGLSSNFLSFKKIVNLGFDVVKIYLKQIYIFIITLLINSSVKVCKSLFAETTRALQELAEKNVSSSKRFLVLHKKGEKIEAEKVKLITLAVPTDAALQLNIYALDVQRAIEVIVEPFKK